MSLVRLDVQSLLRLEPIMAKAGLSQDHTPFYFSTCLAALFLFFSGFVGDLQKLCSTGLEHLLISCPGSPANSSQTCSSQSKICFKEIGENTGHQKHTKGTSQ